MGICNDRVNEDIPTDEARCCGSRIVKVHKPWHICMFLMSISEPGSGAYFNACCCHADKEDSKCVFANIIAAMVMMATAVCIVGILHSMQFGLGIYRLAEK